MTYTVARSGLDGNNGKDGTNGNDGISVSSVIPEYYLSTSETELLDGVWSSIRPEWQDGLFLWTRLVTTYSDDTVVYGDESVDTTWKSVTEVKADIIEAENRMNLAIDTVTTNISDLSIKTDLIEASVETMTTTTTETATSLITLTESYNSFVNQTSNSLSAILTEAKTYTDELTEQSRTIATYFEATSEGLRISASDSENEDLNRVSTLMAPDSFQVQFDGVASTKVFNEGIETGSMWLSTALSLNPLIFTGYGSGESGGVVIKWRGFD